jgi:hypothetical protein
MIESNAPIAVRGMKRMLNEIGAASSTEAVPSRQHRESLHSAEAVGRSAAFADCSAGSPSAIAASFAARRGIGTLTSSRHPTVLPIRILQLCPAAHLNLSPHYSASRKSGLGVASVWSSIIERASGSELDLGARRESRSRQMLRPPFRAARNHGDGCLTAGHLQ